MGEYPVIFVINEGDALARPIGTVSVKMGAVLGAPIMEGLLVDSSVRRKGIGRPLIRRAEQRAKDEGATRIFAVTHPDNLPARQLMQALHYAEMILLEKKL